MNRHAKALLTFLGCLLIGCSAVLMPRVVTVVTPYVPILPMDTLRDPGLMGAVRCDLAGYPVILLKPGMSPADGTATLIHEQIHVAQAQAHRGGCRGLRQQMATDSMFRLAMEADAFCGTFSAQRTVGLIPDPSLGSIIETLRTKYQADYDSSAIVRAMYCR